MRTLSVIQHTDSEHLGLIEDHFEGRSLRFKYARPYTSNGKLPPSSAEFDGLVVLGAGPYGVVSGHLLPSLTHELRLIEDFLANGKPVLGLNTGAILLAIAAGGGATDADLALRVGVARRSRVSALGGFLPETLPYFYCGRDQPVLPAGAAILAADADGTPVIFAPQHNALGFLCHPGYKVGMLEDMIMEFDSLPDAASIALQNLREHQLAIATALGAVITGFIQVAELGAS